MMSLPGTAYAHWSGSTGDSVRKLRADMVLCVVLKLEEILCIGCNPGMGKLIDSTDCRDQMKAGVEEGASGSN